MLAQGTALDIGDHSVEVVGNPAVTGDRYRVRIVAEPGGPGIKGDFPHSHPILVETFRCVAGDMVVRIGRDVADLMPGEVVEVAPGQVHGFLNAGTSPLVIDSEVIFPEGYREEDDLMLFGATYDRLRREGPIVRRTGEPPLLQMAVLANAYSRIIRQPGMAGRLIPLLAVVGKLRGYRSTLPDLGDDQ